MAIRVVTDSACDVIPEEAQRLGITVIPLTLTWDGVEYKDAVDMNHTQFINKLTSSDTVPTTSQIPPTTFGKVFKELTATGDAVIAITISSELSGTCQSANIAANECDGEVYVVDSLNASIGQRMIVLQALEMIEQGMDAKSIVAKLNEDKGKIRFLARLDTLEYLSKGGRISKTIALAGGLLSIKPVISVIDGGVSLKGKARGIKNANNLIYKLAQEIGNIDTTKPLGLVYSGLTDENLQSFMDQYGDLWGGYIKEMPIYNIGAVIGTHIGPGAIGMAFFIK